MQFKMFKNIVNIYRPEVEVYPHGNTMYGDGRTNVVIGNRLYCYSGSYYQILGKLGINFAIKEYYDFTKEQLENYKEMHEPGYNGKLSILNPKGDFSQQIKYYENELVRLDSLPYLDEDNHILIDNNQIYHV